MSLIDSQDDYRSGSRNVMQSPTTLFVKTTFIRTITLNIQSSFYVQLSDRTCNGPQTNDEACNYDYLETSDESTAVQNDSSNSDPARPSLPRSQNDEDQVCFLPQQDIYISNMDSNSGNFTSGVEISSSLLNVSIERT